VKVKQRNKKQPPIGPAQAGLFSWSRNDYAFAMPAKKLSLFLLAVSFFASVLAAQQPAAAPVATPAKDAVVVSAPGHNPVSFSASDLKAMPQTTVTFHNSHTNADETYTGVRLAELLAKFNAPLGSELRGKALSSYIVATGSDGYKAVLALAEVDPSFHPGEVLVADSMNGKPLDAHNGPFKLVVTEDKRPARSVRNLVSIELRSVQ
jgi:DMSO/TMAO reductase YedYZ molybdopterin-dependent catalytic subunit